LELFVFVGVLLLSRASAADEWISEIKADSVPGWIAGPPEAAAAPWSIANDTVSVKLPFLSMDATRKPLHISTVGLSRQVSHALTIAYEFELDESMQHTLSIEAGNGVVVDFAAFRATAKPAKDEIAVAASMRHVALVEISSTHVRISLDGKQIRATSARDILVDGSIRAKVNLAFTGAGTVAIKRLRSLRSDRSLGKSPMDSVTFPR
jgi:hypothetical protein